jgi:dethiobiotin synthetase
LPSRYELSRPLSPHQAAALDEVQISTTEILKSARDLHGTTVIEGAGGLLVPLNANEFIVDLIPLLKAQTILVASSGLGTINHTLLSLEALRARDLEPIGVILVGDDNPSNLAAIQNYGRTRVLGRIPRTQEFSADFFRDSFARLNWPRPEVPSYAH